MNSHTFDKRQENILDIISVVFPDMIGKRFYIVFLIKIFDLYHVHLKQESMHVNIIQLVDNIDNRRKEFQIQMKTFTSDRLTTSLQNARASSFMVSPRLVTC